MHGKALMIALALSIFAAPAFAAAVGPQAAANVQATVGASFASGPAAVLGEAPANASARVVPVSSHATANGPLTFKDVSDLLAEKGVPKDIPPAFCARFGLNCGGQPWPVHSKGAKSDKDSKSALIGKISNQETVVIFRQDIDKTKGELYVCDAFGTFIRGYVVVNNGAPSQITADQARAGFDAEKKWWMNWLPDNAVVAADATASR